MCECECHVLYMQVCMSVCELMRTAHSGRSWDWAVSQRDRALDQVMKIRGALVVIYNQSLHLSLPPSWHLSSHTPGAVSTSDTSVRWMRCVLAQVLILQSGYILSFSSPCFKQSTSKRMCDQTDESVCVRESEVKARWPWCSTNAILCGTAFENS